MFRYLAIAYLIAPCVCLAGEFDYQCSIERDFSLEDKGDLKRFPKRVYAGSRFAVKRSTGEVVGGPFMGSPSTETKVIDRGSDKQAFKVLYVETAGGMGNVDLLVISEFRQGSTKPFVALISTAVISGVCK